MALMVIHPFGSHRPVRFLGFG
uniref:Uncharacterized protein n=1 Tax=Anguilla anguilla TaxID=7936 RepID=A0A0E9RUM4_ANGAN